MKAACTVEPLPGEPLLAIQGPAAPVVRPQSGTVPAVFTVSLPASVAYTVTVQYSTADGTAKANTDYTPASGTLTFKPGTISISFKVAVKPNAKATPDQVFYVKLSNPNWALLDPNDKQAACTVEPLPVQTLAIQPPASPVVRPKSGTVPAVFTVTLPQASPFPVTVKYSTADGTAKANTDYAPTSGTLTFAAGVTPSRTIKVAVKANATATTAESFSVKLISATWATLDPNDQQAACTVEPFGFTAPVVQSLGSYSAAPQQGKGAASLLPAAIDAVLAETASGQLS